MIEYFRGAYGANLLLRWNGSSLARAFIPGGLSVLVYLALHYTADPRLPDRVYVHHPYAVGVLVGSVSFLIVFRANYGYQRYWEACTATHTFMSKWMDATHFAGLFHLQAEQYAEMKPPSFYDYDDLNGMSLTRDREEPEDLDGKLQEGRLAEEDPFAAGPPGCGGASVGPAVGTAEPPRLLPPALPHPPSDAQETKIPARFVEGGEATIGPIGAEDGRPPRRHRVKQLSPMSSVRGSFDSIGSIGSGGGRSGAETPAVQALRRRRYAKSISSTSLTKSFQEGEASERDSERSATDSFDRTHLLGTPRLDGGWGKVYQPKNERGCGRATGTYYSVNADRDFVGTGWPRDGRGFASTAGGRTPSLFLQELAHLSSLCCAVAVSTLRNDMDDVESPLDVYVPGQPFPVADPVNLPDDVKEMAYQHHSSFSRMFRYMLGIDQTKRSRTVYNAARPMLVVGGVSDAEVAFIQRARGPYAKTQLVWGWLSEFVVREHLAGGLGDVGPPIVSRIVQFLSDGMISYNLARKTMYVPFPFPHAQLSAFFVLAMTVAVPFLMDQYANEAWLGICLTFLTVTCLAGLHEVARELENPFRNAPNDIPLGTLLAFYNEALVTMFAGFHPDAYWGEDAEAKRRQARVSSERRGAGRDERRGEDGKAGPVVALPDLGGDASSPTEEPRTPPPERPGSAVPQSTLEDVDLKELREMVESQAGKIRELQSRVVAAGDDGGGGVNENGDSRTTTTTTEGSTVATAE